MAKRNVTFGLEKWQQGLVKMGGPGLENMKSRFLRSSGLRLNEHLDDLTPARTGRLKGSMTFGDKDNVFDLKVGKSSYVFVGTAVSYAQYVNDGYTQLAGQFVPGYWRSGTFHYDPKHKDGIVLTGKVIPGAHMFEKAMDELEADVPQLLEYEFRRLYQMLFG